MHNYSTVYNDTLVAKGLNNDDEYSLIKWARHIIIIIINIILF